MGQYASQEAVIVGAGLADKQVPDGDDAMNCEHAKLRQPAEGVMGKQGGQPLAAGLDLA